MNVRLIGLGRMGANMARRATTLREVHSASRHSWSAIAAIRGAIHQAPTLELDVVDRVGGGDGFASGLFYGLLAGLPAEEALRLGLAHSARVATYPGDTTMAAVGEVRALAAAGSSRIQRWVMCGGAAHVLFASPRRTCDVALADGSGAKSGPWAQGVSEAEALWTRSSRSDPIHRASDAARARSRPATEVG